MTKFTEKSMIIDGIAAAQTVDSSGEILQIKGCDISSLKEGKGVLNWEHQGPPKNDDEKKKGVQDSPRNSIGKIIYAKKIFGLEDCDDDRQKFFYKKVNVPMVYIKARLFDGTGHDDARAAAASFRDAVVHKEAPIINFSIEGHTIEKEGNKIMVSMARAVAATHKPCNKAAVATVFHDPVTGEKHEIEGKKKDELTELVSVDKSEVPGKQTLSSVPVDYDCIVDDPFHVEKEAVDDLAKTLTAGGYGGAPGTLTGGSALQREDLRKKVVTKFLKNQFLGAVRDFDPYVHKDFKKFLKSRLPEVDDSFIDYFGEMAEQFKMRKSEEHRVRRLEFLTIELAKNNAAFKMDDHGFMQPSTPSQTGAAPVVANPPALKEQAPHNLNPGEAPIHLNAAQHGMPDLNVAPEQHEMIHGLHFNQPDAGHVDLAGHASNTRKVKLPNGQHGILKKVHDEPGWNTTSAASPAHAEVLYHNAAKNFFGMGNFVPTTAGIQTDQGFHSVQTAIPGARHLHDAVHEDGTAGVSEENWNILQNHGQKGDLDKLSMMNAIMGNRDRHSGNFMFAGDQMHLIDHGHSFSYNAYSDAPADPGYLTYYHHGITGSPQQADHLNVKIHPEAANWAMSLKPQNLVRFLKGHGASMEVAMHAGARLSQVQRTIQKKGMNTGVWEAYHAAWGNEHLPNLGALLHSHNAVQDAQAHRVANPTNATPRV
jgi:hypothetical protein